MNNIFGSNFKVSELIEKLQQFNPDAYIVGVYNSIGFGLKNIGYGGGDGCTKSDCAEVTLNFSNDVSEQAN